MTTTSIALVGGGNMASALIGGLLQSVATPTTMHVIDPNQEVLDRLQSQWKISTSNVIDAKLMQYDAIIFAVKPQHMREVAQTIAPYTNKQLFLSVAAGIRTTDLSRWLGGHTNIIRAMPNTPALIGLGISGLFAAPTVTSEQRLLGEKIMRAVGETIWVNEEHLIDTVTAVSGSGPAYVFYFIEAMQNAAMTLGLTPEQANQLALATFHGASQLALQSHDPVNILRERVTSKGGTTYAALTSMHNHHVSEAIVQAIKAAAQRGKELGDEFGID